MNVYDFDETIFYPDSSFSFIRWSLRKRPALFFVWAPVTLWYWLLFLLGLTTKEKLKKAIFGIVKYIDDIDSEVLMFWDQHERLFSRWYLEQKRDDDLIISASPEFLLKPIAERLGVALIASKIDKQTAEVDGLTCAGDEKVRRFREEYGNAVVENFYSDSRRDTPMAKYARNAFLVVDRGRKPIPWKF